MLLVESFSLLLKPVGNVANFNTTVKSVFNKILLFPLVF